jgi:hypothetical protein
MARSAYTQTSLAAGLGMSQSALARRLVGQTDWTVAELVAAAGILGCSLSDLMPEAVAS